MRQLINSIYDEQIKMLEIIYMMFCIDNILALEKTSLVKFIRLKKLV
jgi:hypothetical protein